MAKVKAGGFASAIFALLIVSGLGLSAARAAESEDLGDFRVGSFAGAFVPNTESWQGSGSLGGLPFNATGELSLHTGWAVGGLLGYSFEHTPGLEWLNIDFELGYVSSSFEKFDGNVAITGVGNFTGPMPLAGQVHTVAAFMNFLATPFGIRQLLNNRLTPFIGAGPGIAMSSAKLQTFSLGSTIIPINSTSDETDFAYNIVVGADYVLFPESAPQLELGISYEYTWIDAKHLGAGAGIQANAGPASGHIFGLVLEYRFKP